LLLLPLVSASARIRHNDAWARQQFAKAERVREALNGRPAAERTRREYQRVIDSYRRVYFGSPASSKADPSVVATAELMVEMGRRFDDNKILRGAVDQYRFLRKEYPGSKYRFDALFTIGEIYKDDLNDPEEARTVFRDFLKRYPHNRLADDARSAVNEIDAQADALDHAAKDGTRKAGTNSTAGTGAGTRDLPRVTGVRHWSTPDYTRVAIDVEKEIKFGSQRIAHPDRIFFDLRDTKLASTLVGKTFDVDDGFLKKIRVAEFEPGRTRIVLEVDDLARYDAFLLPDPYRLIIDIHGKQKRGTAVATANPGSSSDAGPAAGSGDDRDAALPQETAKQSASPVAQGVSKTGHDAVRFSKTQPVETDLPCKGGGCVTSTETATPGSGPSDSAKPARAPGVIKTTVAVQGSNRRIPKTIVTADDEVSTPVAALEPEKVRSAGTGDPSDAPAGAESLKTDSTATTHRKKSRTRPSSAPPDTGDLKTDARDITREARPTADGDRSLIRALGLKIGKIVIDAGHGGHDAGTVGPNGLLEKDVVLDVAKRLGRLLETRLGAEVIYTRQDDTFIPLETRTAIANRERADLFISIHANSSHDSDARGVETYYLNFTSSPEALEVAARENAVSEKSIHELQDLVKKIALKEKIEESREFAGDVQESLYGGLALNTAGVRNRGIKKAPFIVLIGANMPSILAEISFVSNPTDERKMETSEHRQRIAESLYRGVSKYVSGLSGVKVASKFDKREGQ
jgi:N-acetylmuramoyl-L-alanine amidase